jgi:hypothetical protein
MLPEPSPTTPLASSAFTVTITTLSSARRILYDSGVPRNYDAPPTLQWESARTHARAERGAYSQLSFNIEPTQLPIVPLKLFCWHSLHNTAARKARCANQSATNRPPWLRAAVRTEARGP